MDSNLGQALSGVRVLDFSQGIAAPHGACLLAEMGAEVIKIEPPGGDWLRGLGVTRNGSSVLFSTFNRGKRGLALDLKQPQGLGAARHLIEGADVMIESNRPGVMERLGLDYESVRGINPRIVYGSVTGFGRTGPQADRPATDAAVQAFSGLSFGAGDMVQPVRVRIAMVDVVTGVYLSQAILGALLQRGRTGQGQHVDVSLMHCISAVQGYKFAEYEATGGGVARELFAAIGIYRCADGFLAISAVRDQQVVDLIRLVGRHDLLADRRFGGAQERFDNQDALRVAIAEAMAARSVTEWLPLLHGADLIAQEVLDYPAFRRHPQTLSQAIFTQTDLGEVGSLPVVRMPGLQAGICSPAPRVGQDTLTVLRSAGLDDTACNAMLTSGAAVQGK
jgi:crotonobetainyl-CoA:carnitine CoA-transferase CaiB-like acyl-CoA transferase